MLIELKNGKRRRYQDVLGRVLIRKGLGVEVTEEKAPTYQTRMMTAEPAQAAAPYGYKADGTPRKRPGRPAAVTEEE